jgi:RNAse (barnase) inhibitor barstar
MTRNEMEIIADVISKLGYKDTDYSRPLKIVHIDLKEKWDNYYEDIAEAVLSLLKEAKACDKEI